MHSPGRKRWALAEGYIPADEPIPRDTDYASVFETDVPVVIQHTRLDSRQAEPALLSTIAFGID